MTKKLTSHEQRKLLLTGETIREKDWGLLLSMPVFLVGIIYYSLIRDREGLAGAYGHLGIAFKNYHKHHWQQTFLIKIAYFLFDKASINSTGEGQVSSILHCGQAAKDLKNLSLAESKFKQALSLAQQQQNQALAAYALSYLGGVHTNQQRSSLALKELRQAVKTLTRESQHQSDSLYLHIWLTHAQLTLAEYYLATNNHSLAQKSARQVLNLSQKYHLQLRYQEAQRLLKKHCLNLLFFTSLLYQLNQRIY